MLELIFALILPCFAIDTAGHAIEQAQALALKKNRKEASATLQRALAVAPAASAGRSKLQETLAQMSKIFFTDKGQKLFENAQSLMFDNPDLALTQFKDSLALEDDNILILVNMAKIYLSKKDCDTAASFAERARTINPWSPDMTTVELRTLNCQKRFTVLRDKVKSLPPLDKWSDAFVQYLVAQNWLEEKAPKKAFDILSKVSEDFPQFPEVYYFLVRAGTELNKDTEPWLQKYSSLCKGITSRERKKFSEEPQLCAHLKEVDDELAKKNAEI